MADNKYHKKYVENAINQAPTTLIKYVQVRMDDGYGGYTSTTTQVPIKARIYQSKVGVQLVEDSGVSMQNVSLVKALIERTDDVYEGDTLIDGKREYRVTLKKDYFDICSQLELEVLK